QAGDLAQDKMGHLWVATLGGLSRFDGKTFSNYTVRDGMLSNTINAVEVDKRGFIWVGSMRGLSKFDGKTFKHFLLQSPENPKNNIVSKIKIGSDSATWCLAGGNVFRVKNNKTEQVYPPDKSPVITALLPENNSLWLAQKGMLLHRKNNNK